VTGLRASARHVYDLVQGQWSDGNTPLIGAMDHGVWLASTVFDGRALDPPDGAGPACACQRVFDSAERVGLACR